MIIIFIIYLLFLIWLFEFTTVHDDINLEKRKEIEISIIIDSIKDINDLLLTIDAIKLQNYNLDKVNLILLDSSTENIKSIIDVYKHVFSSIDVFKVSEINKITILHDIDYVYRDYILFIESGISLLWCQTK